MKPYNKLKEEDKKLIIDTYYSDYEYGKTSFKDIADLIGVSERSFSRVLRESGVNTKRKNKYTLNEKYFEKIDTEEKAYLLGVLFADGCVTNYNYIVLQQSDYESVSLFKKQLDYTGEIKEITGKQAGGFSTENTLMYRVHFSSESMSNDLIKWGKNNHMEISDIPNIEKSLIRHFVRGYFDGDGGFYVSNRTSYYKEKKYTHPNPIFSIICTSEFAKSLNKYFKESLGIENMKFLNSKTDGMVYIETRSKKNCVKIYNHLYENSTCFLSRKHDKFKSFVATCTSNSAWIT